MPSYKYSVLSLMYTRPSETSEPVNKYEHCSCGLFCGDFHSAWPIKKLVVLGLRDFSFAYHNDPIGFQC